MLLWFGAFGFSPLALVCALGAVREFGVLVAPNAPPLERVLVGATTVSALLVGSLQLGLYGGLLVPPLLWALLPALWAVGYGARRTLGREPPRFTLALPPVVPWPLFAVSLSGGALAFVAAYYLPIWQWDSLGYHLPFVNFVLEGGGFRRLPIDVPYLSTYPRNVELLFVLLRAHLPDDRLVDLGQIPLGVLGALATMGLARRFGASGGAAMTAGLLWMSLPAVFLQLPTNYIDLGTAAFFLLASYFLVGDGSRRELALAAVSIGLFLGTKPNTPPQAALLGALLLLRARRSGRLGFGVSALGLGGLLGLEAYLTQLLRHGNPVWPAIVKLGPWTLPGTISVEELLSSGAGTQKVYGSLLSRIWQSWSTFDSMPVFDMRVGGLSPIFWLALPLAGRAAFLAGRSALLPTSLLVVALVTPDSSLARYIFPVPALVLAGAAVTLSELGRRFEARPVARRLLAFVVAGLAGFNYVYASPGLVGEGPPLHAYPAMTVAERRVAVGAHGSPLPFTNAVASIPPGTTVAFDRSVWLPYLMWDERLERRVERIPDQDRSAHLGALLARTEVRLLFLERGAYSPEALNLLDRSFSPLFRCPEGCVAYSRNIP